MGSFGERLRREREMRKISLDEIAAATKIGTRHLRALEDEDFKKLPGGIFNKGFVRAYARFLGINEDQAVSDYLAAASEPESETTEVIADQLAAKHEIEKKAKSASRELESINRNETGIPWGAIAALVLVIAGVAGGWSFYSRYKAHVEAERTKAVQSATAVNPSRPAVQPQDAANASTATTQQPPTAPQSPTNSGVGTTGPAAQPAGSPEMSNQTSTEGVSQNPGDGFVISIRATKTAWISVIADGKHLMSLNLTPSDAKSIRARNVVLLTTGNAGGVQISFNGKPIPPLGGEGEVRKATFTPQGMQQ